MYQLEKSILLEESTWSRSFCDGYFFLVDSGEALIHHASIKHFKTAPYSDDYIPPHLWNYKAHVIILLTGADGPQPASLISLYNLKKTENLIILQEDGDAIKVWTHILYTETIGLQAIDEWSHAGFLKKSNVFPRKFDNFHGSRVRVATFELEPFVVFTVDDKGNFTGRIGIDMHVIDSISKAKNFTVDYFVVSTDEKWGEMYPNGSWNGLTGQVFHEISDIGAGNSFMNGMRAKLVDYSYPYNYMPACFVVPSPKPLPNWQSPTLPFSLDTWISVGISLFVIGVILYFLSAVSVKEESVEFKSLSFNFLYILGSLTSRSISRMPAHMPVRIYAGFVWLFSLIISTAYSANLVAFLSIVQIEPPITTLEQLSSSSLRISGHTTWMSIFGMSTDRAILDLGSRMEERFNFYDVLERVEGGEFAMIQNRQFLELNKDARFTYGGKSTIRIVEECFMNFNVGLILPKNSPLTDNLTTVLMNIFESGLLQKWKNEVVRYVYRRYKEERANALISSPKVSSLNLNHVQGIFCVLGIGYFAAVLFLGLENILKPKKE